MRRGGRGACGDDRFDAANELHFLLFGTEVMQNVSNATEYRSKTGKESCDLDCENVVVRAVCPVTCAARGGRRPLGALRGVRWPGTWDRRVGRPPP